MITEILSPTTTSITVHNPADGSAVGSVEVATRDTIADAARSLREHQTEWESIGASGRKKWLMRFQEWILDNAETITDVVQSETGKSRSEAGLEAPLSADLIKYWAGHAEEFLADRHPTAHTPMMWAKRLTATYRPYPVVGVIAPWNYPFANIGLDGIPALAAGAALLVKPSEVTPLSAEEFARGWREIGAPEVLAVVHGRGDAGAAVIDNVDYVHFTGSTATGRKVAAACAERLTPYSLELGGKDPALVMADADLDRAVNGITWGGMFNAGQTCIATERVYVEEQVYEEFVAKLTEKVESLRVGQDDRDFRFDIGALATPAQLDIVTRHVEDAVDRGARITTGGRAAGTGNFFQPTVIADADHTMLCIQEETFGPTLPIVKVADEAEAIRLANDSNYGLSASVWTGNAARGQRIARQLQVGAVNINDVMSHGFNFPLPWAGWKDSGVGSRNGGAAGLLKYCRPQAITAPRFPTPSSEMLWFPYSRSSFRIADGVIRATAARGLRRLGSTPR